MKNVSTQFRNELNNGNRYYVKSAEITLKDGTTLEISNSNLWQNGMILESATSNSSSFDISSIIIGQLTLSLNNIDEEYSDYDFTDCTADNIRVGLELSDGTVESLSYGKFFLNDASYNGSIITLTFYDSLYKFDKSYTESTLEYPATLEDIVQDACEVCGVTLGTYGFDHDDYLINERPTSDGLTFRQILLWVGQISCNYFTADPQGRLKISWYDTKSLEALITNVEQSNLLDSAGDDILDSDGNPISTDKEVTTSEDNIVGGNYHIINHFSNLSVGLDDVVITGIKISYEEAGENGTEITTYQAGTDGYVLEVSGNKLIQSGDAAQQIVQDLGAKIIGLRFRTFTASALSDPTYEAGDVALLIDRKGKRYKSLITNNTFQPGNFQSMSCGATAPARQSASRYSQITQVYVDYRKDLQKEKTEREQALEELQNRVDNSSGLFTTIEQQPDGSNIYYLHNKPQLSDSDIIWTMTAEAWTVSTNGGETPNAGMTVDGDTIVRILTAVGVNADWIKTGAFVVEKDGQIMFRADTDTGQVDIVANSFSLQGQSISDIAEQQVNDFVDATYTPAIDNLQAQIDGQIETWFYDYIPTTSNYPASNWTTDTERDKHLGDLFYVVDNAEYGGQAYRWAKINNAYTWDYVEDTAVTKALADAASAQDTADQKRRVFVSQPVPPYDVGDLWVGNSSSDLMRCQTSRQSGNYNATDWIKAVKYTDDSELQAFIQGDYADTIEEIKTQADQKAETWYQSTDPSINWSDDEKSEHKGDLWYNTSEEKTYIYNGTSWQETRSNPPDEVFDTINGKAQIFIAQPVTPYDVGDVWFTGTSIMVCNTARTSGNFNSADWQKKDNYTDDSALYEFIEGDYQSTIENLQEQADQKAETWYQATDPSASWSTADKAKHKGDLWYNTTEQKTYIYNGSAWEETKSNPPDEVFDTIDGKAQVFVTTPTPPYNIGDLWAQGITGDIMRCQTNRTSGSYNASDWVRASKYTDDSLAEQVQEELNNMEIGGRNLAQLTNQGVTGWTWNMQSGDYTKEEILSNGIRSCKLTRGNTSQSGWSVIGYIYISPQKYEENAEYTVSFDVLPSVSTSFTIALKEGDGTDALEASTQSTGNLAANSWSHITVTITTKDTLPTSRNQYLYMTSMNSSVGVSYTFKNLKIEKGNKATGWSPAPEDTETYADNLAADLQEQIDGKIQTYSQTSDPSASWTTTDLKTQHTGDLWYNPSTKVTQRWSGTTWVKLENAEAEDAAELAQTKAQIFISQPIPPYSVGDLWFNSATSDIMTCVTSRASGSYTSSDWQKRNKYTDDSYAEQVAENLSIFSSAVTGDLENLQTEIDGKIETYYYDYQPTLTNVPASQWTTAQERAKHVGDLFYWRSKGFTYRFTPSGSSYVWQAIQDSDITEALQQAANAQDTADSKRRVFYTTPSPPYDAGDLWAQGSGGDIMRCKTARQSGAYVSTDWELASKYTDDTAVDNLDESLDQEGVFNRLTNNGATQGIYLENGQLYINASYIQSGIVSADRIDVTGIFAQDITATGTITGANLVGATGTFSGTINASGGTFSGNINCTGTITGANLVGATGTFTGTITGSTIVGGEIRSSNYVANSSGTIISLNDGTIKTASTHQEMGANYVSRASFGGGSISVEYITPIGDYIFSVHEGTLSLSSPNSQNPSVDYYTRIDSVGIETNGTITAYQNITNDLICNGTANISGSSRFLGGAFAPWIELSSSSPYIDFHYGSASTTDYTARIIADGTSSLRIYANGGLFLTGGTFIVEAQNSTNEGGEIRLNGAGSNKQICIDNLSGNLRIFTNGGHTITFDTSSGGLRMPFGGLTVGNVIESSVNTGGWLAGNNGTAIISSTSSGDNFNVLARMLAPTGRFIMGQYDGDFFLAYTRNSTIQAGTNYVDSLAKLLNNNGNTTFPGTVTAANFSNSSLEELKTNIVPFDSALDDILNTDVYSYSLKRDIDNGFYNTKYGFIIGTGYRLSEKILSEEKDGIELYSAIALLWKGVQELYELVSGMGIIDSRIDYLQSQLDQAFERIEQLKKASV